MSWPIHAPIALNLTVAVCLFGAPNAMAQSPITPSEKTAAFTFDKAMRDWLTKHQLQRASVAVMRNEKLVFASGYGGRGANERIPVWSLSKAVTAACIATLVQDGKLKFEEPVGRVLEPVFVKFGSPVDQRMRNITVSQLLSHRSGLPASFGDNKFAPGAEQILQYQAPSATTVDVLLPEILKIKLATNPDTGFAYSNVGYLLLGQIIEVITSQPYEVACADRVLLRAGIKSPALDKRWGRLLQATAGWAMSGPEYLAFSRLLLPTKNRLFAKDTQDWLRKPEGRWLDDRRIVAYTLGVRLHTFPNAQPNLFHGGGWLWSGAHSEKSGTWFVLTNDGTAWFASYDGVHADTDAVRVAELQEVLWRAYRSTTDWPMIDGFQTLSIGPVRTNL